MKRKNWFCFCVCKLMKTKMMSCRALLSQCKEKKTLINGFGIGIESCLLRSVLVYSTRKYQSHSLEYSPSQASFSPDTWWTVSWWCDDGDIMWPMTPPPVAGGIWCLLTQSVLSIISNDPVTDPWLAGPEPGCILWNSEAGGWRRLVTTN